MTNCVWDLMQTRTDINNLQENYDCGLCIFLNSKWNETVNGENLVTLPV